ncbi:histone-lysine N-methyltransferase EZ3 isoform X3 [Amborella trichopoda]|uniref:histone-lysine N-methyltransferase EZ3 isoform X3 n=1 Tax=Amborella trichopoda TaxID=13333 RepID=UPI0009BD353C|nr:histone-lysine N-methyltransferase EZ3 isoform X3 [Amborella trichopoda]|eukprot:XP_020520541.1 histone-lysine N-methyltransferase EZ3 isoform X3 [Amborella trichopoda]
MTWSCCLRVATGSLIKPDGEQDKAFGALVSKVEKLINLVLDARLSSIKERIERNRKNLEVHTFQLQALATLKKDDCSREHMEAINMLSIRSESALCQVGASDIVLGDRDNVNSQEEESSSVIIFGNSSSGKSIIRPIRIPYIEKLPPYTSWIYLERNQRMAEDQSVVGRRRIYYDACGSEALICSDSEEEFAEREEEKHEFSEGEDRILWNAIQGYGLKDEVLNTLSQFIDASSFEIKARYETLVEQYEYKYSKKDGVKDKTDSEWSIHLNRSLSATLDSFDNLFCRRCLVFDCRLHGCSHGLITPIDKQAPWSDAEESGVPCSNNCYLVEKEHVQDNSLEGFNKSKPGLNFEKETTPVSSSNEESIADTDYRSITGKKKAGLKKGAMPMDRHNPSAKDILDPVSKRQKIMVASDVVSVGREALMVGDHGKGKTSFEAMNANPTQKENMEGTPDCQESSFGDETILLPEKPKTYLTRQSRSCHESHEWSRMEKDLYTKGLEIFGKNSCLIARNLLSGLKTCKEVADYMLDDEAAMHPKFSSVPNSSSDENGKPDADIMDMPARPRILRRRSRARKLKYTWKSAGHPSIRKRMADGKQQSCKQYTPCGCDLICGKECPCMNNGTCCEKYCGCPKICKNRFRGCHCAKSQCRSRQCPCFAAGRECDPDVCRNCWVSCGDGTLGGPPLRGDNYNCGNMKLLLKQQQRILLGKSDVAGWGAFLKNPVNRNDYLGEYTGELISHREADKRGKIYDRANSSFLFNLNDQFVLDAFRKGDKLKFANHSSNPNCYAKVMMVAGDHRVGIYAKEHIEASEELFYDYRYEPDRAPIWARRPEGSTSKRDDTSLSFGRAPKIA